MGAGNRAWKYCAPKSQGNAMHKALSRIFAAESKSLKCFGVLWGAAMQNNLKCHMKFVALLIARVKQSKRGIGTARRTRLAASEDRHILTHRDTPTHTGSA